MKKHFFSPRTLLAFFASLILSAGNHISYSILSVNNYSPCPTDVLHRHAFNRFRSSFIFFFFFLVIFTVGVISRSFLFTSICRRIYHGDSRVFFYGNENNLLHHRLCDQRRFSLSQIDLADSSIPEWFICNRSILMLESVHSGDWLSPTGSDGFVSDHATDYEIRYAVSLWI